jgi:hypothetical protein
MLGQLVFGVELHRAVREPALGENRSGRSRTGNKRSAVIVDKSTQLLHNEGATQCMRF